jgi:hypothetical protein
MEVHHHSNSSPQSGGKWKHYFWEFFMLFLAVTLSFLVENQREHYVERQRAKVYARAMLDNLRADTAELKVLVAHGNYAVIFLDSFIQILSRTQADKVPSGKLYWYGLWGGYFRGFESNDATFQQMRNSGSLRYFDNFELEKKIGEYDQLTRQIKSVNSVDQATHIETRKARASIFDFRYNNMANEVVQNSVYNRYNQATIDSFIQTDPPLLSTDKQLFNEYAELCRSRNFKLQQRNYEKALAKATEIIKVLEHDFHL